MSRKSAKETIIENACRVFSEKGYDSASLKEIAEASGTTKSNIIYHFQSKEGVYKEVIKLWDMDFEETWMKIDTSDASPSEKIVLFVTEIMKSDLSHPLRKSYFEYVATITSDIVGYMEKLNEGIDVNKVAYRKILSDGVKIGEFRNIDVELYTDILHGSLIGIGEGFNNSNIDKIMKISLAFIDMFLDNIKK